MAWFPPGVDPVEHSALVTGIPPWLENPLRAWVGMFLADPFGRPSRPEIIQAWDTATRSLMPSATSYSSKGWEWFWGSLNEERKIVFLDFLVHWAAEHWSTAENSMLETILRDAGSEWRVGVRDGNAGLEKRVPQGVADAADAIMQTSGAAGALLSEAWHAAFGREPNPEEAYEKAIKAVEEAGAEKVAPKNGKTTLGTMARDMEFQSDWMLPLGDDPRHPSADVVNKMVRALWSGQESRHGGNGYRKPTGGEAEAAVLLAVPLVQWFAADTVQRRT